MAELYEDWVHDLKVEFSDSICLAFFFVGFHGSSYSVVFQTAVNSTFCTKVKFLYNRSYPYGYHFPDHCG